jgi:hypothetical protein
MGRTSPRIFKTMARAGHLNNQQTTASNYPRSMSVLSPIFNVLVSPLIPVSLPMSDASKTISKRLEKEPMMEFFMME